MSAREETAVASAARELLAAHGAHTEDADRYAAVLESAGLLVTPQDAEDLLTACREQARAEVRAELDDLSDQLAAARSTVEQQQEELSALRPPHRQAPGCMAEYGGPGYTRCELTAGHDGRHASALGSMRRATWGGEDW